MCLYYYICKFEKIKVVLNEGKNFYKLKMELWVAECDTHPAIASSSETKTVLFFHLVVIDGTTTTADITVCFLQCRWSWLSWKLASADVKVIFTTKSPLHTCLFLIQSTAIMTNKGNLMQKWLFHVLYLQIWALVLHLVAFLNRVVHNQWVGTRMYKV